MKINLALIVAICMGMAGALLNWLFLNQKSKDVESISFLGVKPGTVIRRGETFRQEQFTSVDLPMFAGEKLKNFIEPWDSIKTVKDQRALRDFVGGELVRVEDFRTPPPELQIGQNEMLMWVPIDRSIVPSLITPGEMVWFVVSNTGMPPPPMPTKVEDPDATEPAPQPVPPGTPDAYGPFRVVSIGNRLGSTDVFSGSGRPPQQENMMGIAVNKINGKPDPKALNLFKLLGGNRAASVIWEGKEKKAS